MAREIVWTGFMTADGIVDSPGDASEGHPHGGWVASAPFDPEAFALKGEELAETSALLLGRRSYDAFWPVWSRSEDHAAWQDLPKYVVSTTLAAEDVTTQWGPIEVLRSVEDVAALKAGEGGALFLHGSAELARNLAAADLIDRYHLLVFPVLLGSGKRAFPEGEVERRDLRLRDSAAYANGVVKLIYDVVR